MKKTNKMFRSLSCLLVIIMLLGMMATMAFAEGENQAVKDASKGVLQFNVVYTDDGNQQHRIMIGSCFLINSNTIVTCAHCVEVPQDTLLAVAEELGVTPERALDRISYTVTITRDVMLDAEIIKKSTEMDFAILRLQSDLKDREALQVRRCEGSVEQTETVFAIGFPAQAADTQVLNTYTSADVTITTGQVNKLMTGENLYSGESTDYVQTSAKITGGNSGGPLVDKNGAVIGICQGATGEIIADDYFYAITVDQVLEICDALGIVYNPDIDPVPETTTPTGDDTTEPTEPAVEADASALIAAIEDAEEVSADSYTEESYAALSDALDAAYEAKNSNDQGKIDAALADLEDAMDALEEAEGSNTVLIIAIAAGAAILIIIIIVVIVVSSGKKKNAKPAQAPRAPMNQAQRPVGAPNTGFAPGRMETVPQSRPATMPVNPDAGETSLLTQSAGETTLLSKNVNGGSLMRVRSSEKIAINAEEFVIGRERKRVNYCVSDNTSISRVHAKFVVRNGVTYLVDLNAANGTFLNGSKASAHQEMALKDGDKIMLADESFLFKA
ncbi:MAG: trypsin-like serine protease [Ruminococcaceae bacterium]|nr:trypsin-like serine protease [Oscillospiraceae bacterium]